MAGIRWPPEDSEPAIAQARVLAASELFSDDDRSVAADSWSIKSDYGSTLDDDQRHADASEALCAGALRAASDYSSDKDEQEDEVETENSMLGLQSYWDSAYADELVNFHEHGHAGEVWFGVEVMEIVAVWTKNLCVNFPQVHCKSLSGENIPKSNPGEEVAKLLARWSVLDIGTGNGLFLQELAKQGFSDLTGTDYSESAVDLARNLADRDGFPHIHFQVDDVLETKLEKQFQLVTDKGTFDAVGLHPDGPARRNMYWESISKLVAPGGLLVITSCNNTKDELVQEAESFRPRLLAAVASDTQGSEPTLPPFRYLDHVKSYPTFRFGGVEGTRVATVTFVRRIGS
ncbi:Protein-lysine N-methyltransferase [Nymphaea thermarum]|nr:Protein-lysine N-methyltransferase [Nymphaea thermarum]